MRHSTGQPNHPLAKQFIPQAEELLFSPDELTDPIGDQKYSPLPGIIHRYPDRLLLMPTSLCAVYCRFCFRRETIGPQPQHSLSDAQLDAALQYIRQHDEIWEVIFSGGDPLMLPPKRLAYCLNALENIPHVKILRLHTRVPLMAPQRITPQFLQNLHRSKPIYLVLHCNHASEFTPQGRSACLRIARTGTPMLAQSVLLRGVNDHPQALAQLWRTLIENRIKPYYLHHPDLAARTRHFRLPIKQGQKLWKLLRSQLSGLCIPQYMLDLPQGKGKTPIAPPHIRPSKHGWMVLDQHHHWQPYTENHL